MPLLTLRDLRIGFRGPALLDDVSCLIEPGERIGLLGRNGAGKTTLLRILSGEVEPDHGEAQFAPGTRVALLPQDVPRDIEGTISSVVAQGFGVARLGAVRLGETIDVDDPHEADWQRDQAVERMLSRMELDGAARFEALSSGMKRRVLLARALVASPDLLLLDEPTNHLDVDAISWLEDFLSRLPTTLIFVTHDRVFLQKLARRILEIDRGRLFDWSCDYETFLTRKEAALAAEEKQNALFDKKLAEEEVWIRTGIKARRTRNEGRVRALEAMRRVRAERREIPGKVQLAIQEAERSGALVAQVKNVSFAYADRPIVRDFSTTIMRGDKIGIIGPNGAGKTTLLRVMLGLLEPQSGSVRLGTNVQIAYFDQLRQQLDDEATVQENVGEGSDKVVIDGQPRHVIGYLRDFLFTPERARTQVRFLSGGERNRILLAKLFAKPANVIVLDEPTNDLDMETLEMLEERLVQFAGTILLVSHDRAFLNNVVASVIALDGDDWREFVGGYDDWLRQKRAAEEAIVEKPRAAVKKPVVESSPASAEKPKRLSFKDQHALKELPGKIEKFEAEIAELHTAMARPEFYQQAGSEIAAAQERLKTLEEELGEAYAKWEELESRS